MKHCVRKAKYGITLRPSTKRNGDNIFEFVIREESDSNYANFPGTRKIIRGYIKLVCDAVVTVKSLIQNIVALSKSEAELFSATQCNHDMIYVYRLLTNIGLKANLPITIVFYDKTSVDLESDWNIGGRKIHVKESCYLQRELKEQGLLLFKWCSGETD